MKNTKIKYATAFISSTFADMKSERNLIMYNVFPKVKRWAFERGIIFDIFDLRWGINDSQAKELHHTVKICLERVNECDPLFICLLGDRYGWIPDKEDFNQAMFQKDISKYIGASATELEIMQALENAFFDSPEKSCVFLFRRNLCFDSVKDELKSIYNDPEHADKLCDLKEKIKKRAPIMQYSAEFEADYDDTVLGSFNCEGKALENILTEKLINILREKYNIKDEDRLICDDPLVHQEFHLKHLSLVPKIERCVNEMRRHLNDTLPHGISYVFLNKKHFLEHQVAHFIDDEREKSQIIYRFIGIDNAMRNINDLVKSIAYEISESSEYLDDLISASLFLKDWFECNDKNITLIVANVNEREIADYINHLRGFKLHKIILFVNTDKGVSERYIEYTNFELELLAKNMLHSRAKSLLQSQLDTVLRFANGDYELLSTTVNYLCTFASYESLDDMISELDKYDKTALTKAFLDKMINIQHSHHISGIMEAVIELLCYTPLPITRRDIIDTVKLYCRREKISEFKIEQEVDFSLCFAKDFIEEYNSRFIITNEALKEIFEVYLTELSNTSPLVIYLLSTYFQRIIDNDDSFELADGQNFCEILKPGFLEDHRKKFKSFILSDISSLYILAKAVTKRNLIELFKALAMQEMGLNTKYLLPDCMSLPDEEALKLKQASAISAEKIFSLNRLKNTDNVFLSYYDMMFSITKEHLATKESFADFINTELNKKKQTAYHKLQLPKKLKLTSSNSELYTIFDARNNAYQTRFGACHNGFFFVIDAFTGEEMRAFALPFDQGEPAATFYLDHKMHVIFEKGIIALIDLDVNTAQFFRFESEASKITAFNCYFSKGYNVMVQDNRTVKILQGLSCRASLSFNNQINILSAFLTFTSNGEIDKLLVIANSTEEQGKIFLIDPYEQRILDSLTLYNSIISTNRDQSNGEVYIETSTNEFFVIWNTDEDKIGIDYTDMKHHYTHNGNGLTSQKNVGIFFNGKLILNEPQAIISSFGTRKVIGFITEDNSLYCIDNGY
jgi:hypothetical protein